MQYKTDIAIIGAGPVGLFAIFEAGMLKMNCHVIDILPEIGGQCSALYPEKPIYDIPAHPHISAGDLVINLEKQSQVFSPIYHLGEQVLEFAKLPNGTFTVITSKGTEINSKAIIVAAGCGAFGPNRPPLTNIEEYENKSIFYFVKDPKQFKNKKVTIAGGGDSAIDWAIILAEIADLVTIIHRRPKFRCAPESLSKVQKLVTQGKIKIETPFQLNKLFGTDGYLTAIELKDFDDNTKTIDCDILLPFFGLAMELGPILNWHLTLDKKHIKVDPATMQTNITGIYAIGDIAIYPGKLKLILTGFSEAALAAHSIYKLVYPNQELHFEYSTTKGITSNA